MSNKQLHVGYFNQGASLFQKGNQLFAAGQYELARQEYSKAQQKFQLVIKRLGNNTGDTYYTRAQDSLEKCQTRLAEIDGMVQNRQPIAQGGNGGSSGGGHSSGGGGGKPSGGKKGAGGDKTDDQKENDEFMNRMSSAILLEKPNVRWEDVAGLKAAKTALNEAVILPLKFKQFFVGERSPWRGILLYGPPGTGKSFIAKATATEADNSTFITVSTSDLVSKWMGESEKLIRALFDTARDHAPAIIFIDEIDSLLSERSENDSESSRRIKTEFLIQMDGVGKSMDGILLLAATNIPWGLDPAVRRRFEKKIYIPLPEPEARIVLIRQKLKKTPNTLTEHDIQDVARRTEGYSGADLKILVREAAMLTIRKLQSAQYFREEDGQYFACGPNDPGAFKSTLMELPASKVGVPPVTYQDFIESIAKVRPSVSPGDLVRFEQWTAEFGQEGS